MKLVSILSFADQASQVIGQVLFILPALGKTFIIIMLIFVTWVYFKGVFSSFIGFFKNTSISCKPLFETV